MNAIEWQFFPQTLNYIQIDLGKNGDVYEVVLNPGDILVVPANWWHYVENSELSLTVNTWIPLVSTRISLYHSFVSAEKRFNHFY